MSSMSVVDMSMEFSPEQPAEVDTCTLDMEEMLGESLLDKKLLREKEHLGHKAIQLLQRRAKMLTSNVNLGPRKLQDDRTDLERQLQGELATRHCQLMAAQVDVEVWKRRTGLLQLRLSSLQEDVDMYAMRAQLLEAEIGQECATKAQAQAGLAAANNELGSLKEQLLQLQAQEKALQATVAEYKASQQQLEAQLAAAAERFEAAQKAAASAAQEAEQRLIQAHEELAQSRAQLKESVQAAAAATERAEELEWRLKRQEATLAERLRMADEAKQATEGLSEEGLRAVREKANFLGEELRSQLAEAREMLAQERRLRRDAEAAAAEAEAGLNRRLEQASADIRRLQDEVTQKNTKIRGLEEACQQQQTKAAMDVVTSLVGDLNPPDTEPRRRPPRVTLASEQLPDLAPVPEMDPHDLPAEHVTRPSGEEAAGAEKEDQPAKQQKRGNSKGKAAQSEQYAAAASRSAEAVSEVHVQGDKKSKAAAARKAAKAEKEAAEAPPANTAAAAKKAAKAKKEAAEAVQEETAIAAKIKSTKRQKESAAEEPVEAAAEVKAGKKAENPSKKRKAEEASSAAAAKSTDISAQEGDESAGDSAMPGGRRGRPGRARASKVPYWMGGAADDSAPAGDDSPLPDDQSPAPEGSDSDWEEAAKPKQAAKRHRHEAGHASAADVVAAAADAADTPAAVPGKPARGRKRAQEIAPLQEEVVGEDSAAVADEGVEEEKVKPAAAGERKLVKAGQVAEHKEAALPEQLENAAEAAEPRTQKGFRRDKGKAAAAPAAGEGAILLEQAEDDLIPAAPDTGDLEMEQQEDADMAAAPSQETSQGPADSEAEAKAKARRVARFERSRPSGVSKLALTTVWGETTTPLADASSASAMGHAADKEAAEKENGGAAAAGRPPLIKPVPGRSRFGSRSEANPLAALNPQVLAAAVKARGSYVSGLNAPNRGGEVAAGKRRLLPAPKPMSTVAALPRDMLFGQNFQIPKLSQ